MSNKTATHKNFRYRIYPNNKQKTAFAKNFGSCRFVWNWALEQRNRAYNERKENITHIKASNELTKLKKLDEFIWLNDAIAQSLQCSLINLDNAFKAFFRKMAGFPKFKSKKNNRQTFHVPQKIFLDFDKQELKFVKFPKVRIKIDKQFDGKIKNLTVEKTASGKYFAIFCVEQEQKVVKQKKIAEKSTIGIDVGLMSFITLSDGTKVDNPKHFAKSQQKLKKLQRQLSKKKVRSNNRNKARLKVARLHEHIAAQRKDFLDKLSTQLANDNKVSTYAVETLNVTGMLKNKRLAKHISSASWSMFLRMLEYKMQERGKHVIKIGRFEPSSKMCFTCGSINNELKLSDRTWTCNECGSNLDRDVNAAKNIKLYALNKSNLVGQVLPELRAGAVGQQTLADCALSGDAKASQKSQAETRRRQSSNKSS